MSRTVHTLLPVNRYVVTYELAYGRPYSKLEELLLRTISEGADNGRTFAALIETFEVHARLITEGLVTLIQEGWVAMQPRGTEMRYLVTSEGRRTVESGRRPSNRRVRTAYASIAREQMSGLLARANELSLITGTQLRKASQRSAWPTSLNSRLRRTAINGGEAERLLPRADQNGEWIRWIDSIARVSQDLHYLPIRVDIDQRKVVGLPDRWEQISPMVIEEVETRFEELSEDSGVQIRLRELIQKQEEAGAEDDISGTGSTELLDQRPQAFAVTHVSERDIALTLATHRELVSTQLGRPAHNIFFVAPCFNESKAECARDLLSRLRDTGANVDLLWSPDPEHDRSEQIVRILDATRKSNSPRRNMVSYNRKPAAVAAELILIDTDSGPIGLIGGAAFSKDAVDSDATTTLRPVVKLSDPGAIAALARLCASWYELTDPGAAALPAHRWKHLAGLWAEEAVKSRQLGTNDESGGPERQNPNSVRLYIGANRAAVHEDLTRSPSAHQLALDPMRDITVTHNEWLIGSHSGELGLSFGLTGPLTTTS